MPIRLIRRLLLFAHVPHHHPILLPLRMMRIRLLIPRLRARHPLIVRIVVPAALPIAIPFNAITAPGAAAAREQPEEPRRPAERHRQPRPDIDIASHRAMDVIVLERGVEPARERGVQNGSSEREADSEDAADGADDSGGEGAQPTEQRGDPDEDLHRRGDDGDDVRDVHPFRDLVVGVQPVLELRAEILVRDAVVQVPDVDGVEPVLLLRRAAVGHVVEARARGVLGEAAGAVVPEADVVEVVDAEGFGGVVGGLGNEGVGEGVFGEGVEEGAVEVDVGGVGAEEVEGVGDGGGAVGVADADDDEGDEGDDGHGHGGEDASEAAEFAHDCGRSGGMLTQLRGLEEKLSWEVKRVWWCERGELEVLNTTLLMMTDGGKEEERSGIMYYRK